MKQRDARAWLFDIIDAGRYIRDITSDKDFAAFESDRSTRQLVERNLEIIGEAVNALLQADPSVKDRIAHTRQIAGLRNRLIHGYFAIDLTAIWAVVENDLPVLVGEAAAILDELEAQGR